MEKRIELRFDKLVVDLTGNKFGRNTYQNQIEPFWDSDNTMVVVIPECIDDIGSSFIQGIYAAISERYGKSEALQMLRLESSKQEIMDKIRKSLETYGV